MLVRSKVTLQRRRVPMWHISSLQKWCPFIAQNCDPEKIVLVVLFLEYQLVNQSVCSYRASARHVGHAHQICKWHRSGWMVNTQMTDGAFKKILTAQRNGLDGAGWTIRWINIKPCPSLQKTSCQGTGDRAGCRASAVKWGGKGNILVNRQLYWMYPFGLRDVIAKNLAGHFGLD